MTESTLSLTYARLRRLIGRRLGYGVDSTAWTSDEQTEIDDAMLEGLQRFYGAYDWSFLKIPIEIPLYAAYSTGTIAVASGVVTLTGGTFPSWAADGDLQYTVSYEVSTRDGNTQVTLVDTSLTVSSGASYTLVQSGYTLPDDFGGFCGDHLTYRPGDQFYPAKVEITTVERIRDMRFRGTDYTDRPRLVAVVPKSTAGTSSSGGQRSKVVFWPLPSAATRLIGRYRPLTGALTSTIIYPYGGMLHSATIIAACRHAALADSPSYDGRYDREFADLLKHSIRIDAETYSPKTLGFDRGAHLREYGDGSLNDEIAPLSGLPDLDI